MHQPEYEKAPLESLMMDSAIFESVKQRIASGAIKIPDSIRQTQGLETDSSRPVEATLEGMSPGSLSPGHMDMLEAIILREGRPPLFIRDDKYVKPSIPELQKRLDTYDDNINTAIKSVARLEILNHPSTTYFGTAWMIDEDIMITNRHVARYFSYQKGRNYLMRTNAFGAQYETQVNFREEHLQHRDPFEVRIEEVLHIEKEGANYPDVALIRVAKNRKLPDPIIITNEKPLPNKDICVIGYPAKDVLRNDVDLMHKLFGNIYQVKRLSPGKVSADLDDHFIFSHDCTTLGGSSGSVVISNESGNAIGLHFSGSFMKNNYAIKGSTLLDLFTKINNSSVHIFPTHDRENKEATPNSEDFGNRSGYNPEFLDETIELPGLIDIGDSNFTPLTENNKTELKYTHYSVKMNKKRKLAAYTASNIDGNCWFQIPRARDKWYFDPRIEKKYQLGNDFYRGNNMHRGHLVRRLDPAWGNSHEMAKQGVEDTFFWTNCTPQHQNFNPRSWLRLEDYVLKNAVNHDLKVSVFTGPVFKSSDKKYRKHQIPEDYWKIIAFNHKNRERISATAYLLSQSEFMDNVEFVYGAFRTYQVPIQKIIALTKINFRPLIEYDPLAANESLGYIELLDHEEIIL